MGEALSVLYNFFTATTFLWLLVGTGVGLIVGVLPGVGSVVAYGILIPFTLNLSPFETIALLLGLKGVTDTSAPLTSVLLGIPGTSGAQATILDGYAMARAGQADRAMGAAYMASVLGGCIGAIVLAVSIPLLRAAVMAFGLPEFFALSVLGMVMVSILSSGAVLKGLIVGCLGGLVSLVGQSAQSPIPRWDFGLLYLFDGVPGVTVFLGLFAIPELMDLFIKGTRISDVPFSPSFREVWKGMKDCFRHWLLIINSTLFGLFMGAVPGIGGNTINWMAYGLARAFCKGASESFGKGDVRGVIAPEAANNSEEPGMVMPTMAFGIPGSVSMALLLIALEFHGIQPGRNMMTEHYDLVLTIVYVLFTANIIGAAVCLMLTKQLAKIAAVRANMIVPLVLVLTVLAAYQGTRSAGDLVLLFSFGLVGWVIKRFGWPRAPFLLAFVLAPITEQYYNLTTVRYEFSEWATRPIVVIFFIVALLSILLGIEQIRDRATLLTKKLVLRFKKAS